MLDAQWHDQRSAWDLQSDGSYVQRQPASEPEMISCQEQMIDLAQKRDHDATRLRRRKSRTTVRRNLRE